MSHPSPSSRGSKPEAPHIGQEFGRDRKSGTRSNHAVDSAPGAQGCLSCASAVLVDPVLDLAGRKDGKAIEAAALIATLDLRPMAGRMGMRVPDCFRKRGDPDFMRII